MFFRTKKFKRICFIVITVLLSIALVIPLASLFQKQPENNNPYRSVEDMIGELEEHLEENPDDVETLAELGGLYRSIYEAEKAKELFEQVLEIDPFREDVLYYMAETNFAQGEFDLALEQLDTIVENNPDYEEAYFLMGYVYAIGMKDYPSGIQAFENYIAIAEPGSRVDSAIESIEEWQTLIEE